MFIKLLLIYIPFVYSTCYLKPDNVWMCNNDFNYQNILKHNQIEKIFLSNYQSSMFKIDEYSSSLRVFNASYNQFQTISITSTNSFRSNLRQLILQSNQLHYFNSTTIFLPLSLEILSLANNQLESLDARLFFSLKNLVKIDLRNNQLKRILPELLINRNILLKNNPLECQCTPDYYRILCQQSTNLRQTIISAKNCSAPTYSPQVSSYLRFSTITLTCPIDAYPPPIIIWLTPFGKLTSMNSSDIDLLSFDSDEPIYLTIITLAGPLTARTKHILHAFNSNQLSITQARASLQTKISCLGINMLGNATYQYDFIIDTFVQKQAIWNLIYTMSFAFFMSLVAGALCMTLKRTSYYSHNDIKTPPIYPTLTPNSAARTPPNFELNQWLVLAASNISETLEQVRDKLRLGVQHVSEHMGRASVILTSSVQHAGGTIRQAAETSAAYLQSFRETSQQRFNVIRTQTSSSLRYPGQFMRTGMNMLTTQVNSLRDYCGVIMTQQQIQSIENSPISIAYIRPNQISSIDVDEDIHFETRHNHSSYAGDLQSNILINTSGIGQLDTADNSALLTLNNFNENLFTEGQISTGIGIFHSQQDELVDEPHRLIMYGEQSSFKSTE